MPLPFVVVKFLSDEEEGTVSEIPTSWLCADEKFCWWPPCKNVSLLVAKSATPNEKTWSKHPVEVEFYCKSLENARKKAEDMYYTSDEEQGRGQRKIITTRLTSISESDTDDHEEQHSKKSQSDVLGFSKPIDFLEDPRVLVQATNAAEQQEIVQDAFDTTLTNNLGSNLNNNTTFDLFLPGPGVSYDNEYIDLKFKELQTHVDNKLNSVLTILAQVKLLCECNTQQKQKEVCANDLANILKFIPCNSIQSMNTLDQTLKNDPEIQKELVLYIKKVGGNTAKDLIWRSLKKIFDYDLAKNCTWLGMRNNVKVCDSKIISTLQESVNSVHNIADKDFEEIAAEWFRQAKQRFIREQKKNHPEMNA